MQPRPAIPPRLVSRLRPCDPRVVSHQSPVSAHQSLTSLESADPRRLLSNKQNAPVSPSEAALTSHFQLIEKSYTLSPVESALTVMSPATPLESALTKTRGGGGPLLSSNAIPPLSFLTVTHCNFRNSFLFTVMQNAAPAYPLSG